MKAMLLDFRNANGWGEIPTDYIGKVIDVRDYNGLSFQYVWNDWLLKGEWLDFDNVEDTEDAGDDNMEIKEGNVVRLNDGRIGIVDRIDGGNVVIQFNDEKRSILKSMIAEVVAEKLPSPMTVECTLASEKIVDATREETEELLSDYDYEYGSGLDDFLDEWNIQKGKLRTILSNHPNWDEDNQMIVLKKENFKHTIDWDSVREFKEFLVWRIREYLEANQIKFGPWTYREYYRMYRHLKDVVYAMSSAEDFGIKVSYRGMSTKEVVTDRENIKRKLEDAEYKTCDFDDTTYRFSDDGQYYVAYALKAAIKLLVDIMCVKGNEYLEDGTFTAKAVATFNNYYCFDTSFVKASYLPQEGQAMTKYFGKICRNIGADKFVDMKTKSWTDDNGVYHEKEYDAGYNHYRAVFGDAMSCRVYTDDVYISINPVDYLTSSLLYGTASCHTIDKENKRRVRDHEHVYSGCNSSGTVSYGIDDVTLVMYTIKRDGDGVGNRVGKEGDPDGPIFRATKMRRMMAFIGEDKIVCSRLYPDGRDGGDVTIQDQFRNILQKTIADCLNADNMWTLKKGRSPVSDVVRMGSGATFYPDYKHYDDVDVSFLRTIDGVLNYKGITVGREPICLNCGDRHTTEDNIICESCGGGGYSCYCDRCGDGIYEDDDDAIFVGGYAFCCASCAEDAGFVYTADWEWESRDDCYQDDWNSEWYHGDPEIIVDDCYCFCCDENAENYGCVYDGFEYKWTYDQRDEHVEDYASGEYFILSWHNYVHTEDDRYYVDEDSAIADGYIENEDGEWVMETDDEEESEVA